MTRIKAMKAVAISDCSRYKTTRAVAITYKITQAVAISDYEYYKITRAVAISDFDTYLSHKGWSYQ
jgi:hypothetical protein